MSLIIVVAFLTLVKGYIPKGQILCFDGAMFGGADVMHFFFILHREEWKVSHSERSYNFGVVGEVLFLKRLFLQ